MRYRSGDILKVLAFLLLAGGAVYVFLFTSAGEMFRSPEGRKILVERLDLLVKSAGPLGPALFILLYAIGSLFAPVTPFTIAGAVIYGKFQGMLYNLAGDLAGASLAFFLGRYFLHGIARNFLETRLPWLDRKAAEEGFSVIFYLRIFWFPFIVLNYAAGATRIRFRDYFLGTALGIAPAVFIVTYFIGALRDLVGRYRQPSDLFTVQTLAPIGLLIVTFFIPSIVKRFRKPPSA
ncbi:MAG: TVP38/TMEM64 family protein [Deltaproteobacteria bacterium]|nr:TVP38/TMEM64 family protein [Deltaproteobacteria bacterium]